MKIDDLCSLCAWVYTGEPEALDHYHPHGVCHHATDCDCELFGADCNDPECLSCECGNSLLDNQVNLDKGSIGK